MKVLFIDPPAPLIPKKNRPGVNLNLGIATLVPHLLNNGHRVSLYDMVNHHANLDRGRLKTAINRGLPDVICIPLLNAQYLSGIEIIKWIKKQIDIPIIVGGAEATGVGERAFVDSAYDIDFLVLGEAEESLRRLLGCIECGNLTGVREIPGLLINENGSVSRTAPSQLVRDLSAYPFPDYEIFGVKRFKVLKILGSRGCPYNCSFCFSYLGRTWRGRRPDNIIEEIQVARERYGIESFRFIDANFNYDIEWTHGVCDAILNSGLGGIPWESGGIRADRLTDDLCRHMVEAGCRSIAIGVETLHPEPFKLIRKGETLEQIKQGVATAVKYFDSVKAFMIIGLPGDTMAKSFFTYKEARKLGPRSKLHLSYAIAVPYTGTRMEKWVDENSTILGSSHLNYTRNELALDHGVAFETVDFTAKERKKTFRILNTREFRYASRSRKHRMLTPLLWGRDAVLCDPLNMHRHLRHILKTVMTEFRTTEQPENSAAVMPDIEYERIPDGTWSIAR
jgi:radical SAM superfamily enzyme YgiQ (UPF0313 family)